MTKRDVTASAPVWQQFGRHRCLRSRHHPYRHPVPLHRRGDQHAFRCAAQNDEAVQAPAPPQVDDVLRKRFLLRLQRGDFGSVCCQLRHQIGNGGTASSYHSRFESEPSIRVNRPSCLSRRLGIAAPDGGLLRQYRCRQGSNGAARSKASTPQTLGVAT